MRAPHVRNIRLANNEAAPFGQDHPALQQFFVKGSQCRPSLIAIHDGQRLA